MTVTDIMRKLELAAPVVERVSEFLATGACERLAADIEALTNPFDAAARERLLEQLGEDANGMKELACQLSAAVITYEKYEAAGLSDLVFWDTFFCLPRFLAETYEKMGEWCFDRGFWTVRQLSLRLFRLGELEYEKRQGRELGIWLHIPSDALLEPYAVDQSLALADSFFEKYFPEYAALSYFCRSWLLAPALKDMLPPDSNILRFASRFALQAHNPESTDYRRWVFQTDSEDIDLYPENTTLQRNLKSFLVLGGSLGSGEGRLNRQG